MKTVCVVVNFHSSPWLERPLGGTSSRVRVQQILQSSVPEASMVTMGPFQTVVEFLEALRDGSAGYDEVVIASSDAPFLRPDLVTQLLDLHRRYRAEYTFADGFPVGLTPEIVSPSILPTLIEWGRSKTQVPQRETLFQVLSTDINRFDVETHLSPVDLRMRRLSLTADKARNFDVLTRVLPWISLPTKELLEKIDTEGRLVRSLPATLLVQIVDGVAQLPVWSPLAQFHPEALSSRNLLSRERWNTLLDKMLAFAGDLTVIPSFWGEPSLHPEVADLFADALVKPGISLCVETSGLGWKPEVLSSLASAAQGNLDWIVELDSNVEETYRRLRGEGFAEAHATAARLLELFPGRVWPQTVRMKDNEAEMEAFYKFWKQKAGQVILQKHNHFGGRLPQAKPADLSPWKRHPCWHAARDLAVFLDGTTVVCRDDFDRTQALGNAFEQDPRELWQAGQALFERHLSEDYPSVCRNCDEYYTFYF